MSVLLGFIYTCQSLRRLSLTRTRVKKSVTRSPREESFSNLLKLPQAGAWEREGFKIMNLYAAIKLPQAGALEREGF